MEIFLDGGLFEMVGLMLIATLINYIFFKKYLLVIYSVITITSPLLMFFIGDRFKFVLISISIFNSIVLVILLWQIKLYHTERKIIDLKAFESMNFLKIFKSKKII